MFDIQEELKKLPAKPGVYLMHDKEDTIIYVGKAIVLKNRVRQYFQSGRHVTQKIEKMISQIHHFEYIVTDSELEALVLESNLIKEYNPRYNTMLTDDKNYPFIRATIHEDYPRLMLARDRKQDKAKYYGPYTSSGAVKDMLELMRKLYKIRSCNRAISGFHEGEESQQAKEKPCLYYHIGQCKAPCQGNISIEEYARDYVKAQEFMDGNYQPLMTLLEDRMKAASESLEFEEAAEYRDLIVSAKHLTERQKITGRPGDDRDIIAIARAREEAVVQVFFVREGKMIGREHYYLTGTIDESQAEIISSFVKQFYSGTPFIPREMMLREEIPEQELILEWLSKRRGQKVSVVIPKKGEKAKLLELAEKNARMVLEQDGEKLRREEAKTIGACKELQELLQMDQLSRIESYDISNISGFQAVGSMVVFEQGRPKKHDYRKFRIKSVSGPDDYASMEEVLTRRFTHGIREREERPESESSFTRFPDLLLMDGGRGQVNIALRVLDKLGLNIPVCGMVKDDHHRTRGLYYNNVEQPLSIRSEAFRLVTRIQDETHRFAIEFHRSLRGKDQVHSILDDIPGIGPSRRKALMRHFTSLEDLKKATVEELEQIPSMNRSAAEKVITFFQQRVSRRVEVTEDE